MVFVVSFNEKDPAVQQAAGNNAARAQQGLEEYNPFDNSQTGKSPAIVRHYFLSHGVKSTIFTFHVSCRGPILRPPFRQLQWRQDNPSSPHCPLLNFKWVNSWNQTFFLVIAILISLQRRQEELERKAQELQRREEELKNNTPYSSKYECAFADLTFINVSILPFSFTAQRNNWPPLPEKFCVQPCFYQDILVEIPLEFQKIVRLLYYIWMCTRPRFLLLLLVIRVNFYFIYLVHTLLYLVNVGGCLALFIQEGSGAMFGLSILYAILFTPASYVCWFRPVYKAFRYDFLLLFVAFGNGLFINGWNLEQVRQLVQLYGFLRHLLCPAGSFCHPSNRHSRFGHLVRIQSGGVLWSCNYDS